MSQSSETPLKSAVPVGSVVADSSEQSSATSIAIAMFCVLLLSYVLMAADRYLFPVLAPDIRKAFGFALSNTGLLSTIFTLGLGLGGLPTGYLLTRFSRKTVLLIGIAIFSGATALTTVAAGLYEHAGLSGGARHRHVHAGDVHVRAGRELFRSQSRGGHRLRQFLLRHRRLSRPLPRRHSPGKIRHVACPDARFRRVRFRDDRVDRDNRAAVVQRNHPRACQRSRPFRRRSRAF